jgi:HSP20 family protein
MSSLQRWDPFRGLVRAQRDLDRLFDSFFGRPLVGMEEEEGLRIPAMDVTETDSEVVVTTELPGVDRKDIDVEVLPESLSLKAEMSKETEDKDETYHRRERVWGRFERTIPLPAEVVSDQVKAVFKDGVLEIRLPKTEQAKASTPRKVKID